MYIIQGVFKENQNFYTYWMNSCFTQTKISAIILAVTSLRYRLKSCRGCCKICSPSPAPLSLPPNSYLLRQFIVLRGSYAFTKLRYSLPWNSSYNVVMKRWYRPCSGYWLNALSESALVCVVPTTRNCRGHSDRSLGKQPPLSKEDLMYCT